MVDTTIYDLQAELCHSMSHPVRLQIIHLLFEGAKKVGDITLLSGLEQCTVSRHLAILKRNGVVTSHRHGQEMIYSVANPKIVEVCNLMRVVLSEQVAERSKMILNS